jgi:hypothetical protein
VEKRPNYKFSTAEICSRGSIAIAIAVVMVACLVVAGCGGSSASTSRAEAVAVARAERAFLKSWGEATAEAKDRCESGATKSFQSCFSLAFESGSSSAMAHFTKAIEEVMANGVGRECAEALEEALAEPFQIPYFPDGATTACRAESRQRS